MKQIIYTPHPVLVTPATRVKKIDRQTLKLITQMRQILASADNPKGVGLAAPQIDMSQRIFLIWPDRKKPIQVFINPEYVKKSKKVVETIPGKTNQLEGCLSIPRVWGKVKRHLWVEISYQDEQGQLQVKKFTNFPAVIVQHEMDHLDGILFTRKVIEQQSTLYRPTTDETGKETLEPIEI